jgi:DNA-binding CsgD family transcriptional regulator
LKRLKKSSCFFILSERQYFIMKKYTGTGKTILNGIIQGVGRMLPANRRLFAAFCLLVTFRFCYQRLCFRLLEKIDINFVFISYCFALIVGITVFPAMLRRLSDGWNSREAVTASRIFVLSPILPTMLGYFTEGAVSVVFQVFSMALVAGAIGLCLNQAAGTAPKQPHMGRFVGCAFSIKAMSGAILFFFPGMEISAGAAVAVLCLLPAAAAVSLTRSAEDFRESDSENVTKEISDQATALPPRKIILQVGGVICLYAIVSGLLDNIYFFDAAFEKIPHFMFFILVYDSVIYATAGYVVDRYRWSTVASISFLLICVGQSMSFFSQHELLVYPYTVFSDAGNAALEVLTVTLPLVCCSRAEKPNGLMAGFGFIAFYGGLLISSVLFVFIPDSLYKPVLGVALLTSLAAVYAISSLTEAYGKFHREEAPLPKISATNGMNNCRERYDFSSREHEVMELLMAGVMTREIAAKMCITERTVNYHVGSMLKKTGSKNRIELIAKVKN